MRRDDGSIYSAPACCAAPVLAGNPSARGVRTRATRGGVLRARKVRHRLQDRLPFWVVSYYKNAEGRCWYHKPPCIPPSSEGHTGRTGHALALAAVQGTPEGLAREGASVLTVVQQHLAIDQHIIDPHGALLDMHLTTRERIHGLARLGASGVRVKDRDVSLLAGGNEAAVMQVVHQGGLARHPVDRVFQRHDLLFPHPVAQQSRAVVRAVTLVRPRAAVGGADDGVGGARDVPLRLWVIIAVDHLEGCPQLIIQGDVQESIHNALALLLRNLRDTLAAERLVAFVP